MKLVLKLFLTLSILLWVFGLTAREKQQILFPQKQSVKEHIILPGDCFEQEVVFEKSSLPLRRYLRVVGGTEMPGRFGPRGETLFREFEYLIDDHLDSVNVKNDKYSLYFKGNNDPFERHAFFRISSIPSTDEITVEILAKREKLQTSKGDFGVELQLYYQKKGRHPDEIYDKADELILMPIEEGSGDFVRFRKNFKPKQKLGNILLRVGGTGFSGECWIEGVKILQKGKLLTELPFVKNEDRSSDYNYWVGVNMVSRNWPLWRVEFKGETIYRGHVFDRASDIADFYLNLPELEGQGVLKLILEKEDHIAAFPYKLISLQLIEETARSFEVISVPKYVTVGDTSGILIEVNKQDINLNIISGKELSFPSTTFKFDKKGLHVIPVAALSPAKDVKFTISEGEDHREAQISQLIVKEKDQVYISSGDEIYIDKRPEVYDQFFKWYLRERVGNWYHFRPSYQWSGVRIINEDFVKHYAGLLDQMHVPYAWQVEGRTLAGSRINPSLQALNTPMFRGKQAHENDGGYYYWQHFLYNGLHSDMAARTRPYGGIFAKHRPIYTEKGIFIHYDPYKVKDMADGARYYVSNLSYSRGESTRHTGPSSTFRYLYQAGYQWLGAEQMYGPEETIMSTLRGASRAYGKRNYGSLHAVQWGSRPFTDPKHSVRFYLSLAVAYIHGSSHINTEEGLWTDEYVNDYHTKAGKEHMHAQHLMLDYIQTHERRGEMDTKIAVLQGRNDAWKSFVRSSVWSQKGDKWEFNKALESFDLVKVFYPENNLNASGPEGWFTSTPYGPVDILPIEADAKVLSRYKALIFLGWNSYSEKDFQRIAQFVEQGGTLLLSAAHLNAELQPDIAPKLPSNDGTIQKLLGRDYKKYKDKIEVNYGKGKVIYYPQNKYPIENEIVAGYTESMKQIASDIIEKEKDFAWVEGAPYVDFTVWTQNGRRTLYLLNTDWNNGAIHNATITINNKKFITEIKQYSLTTVHCEKSLGLIPQANTTDVLEIKENIDNWEVVLQTTGKDIIEIFNAVSGKQSSIVLTEAGLRKIVIEK